MVSDDDDLFSVFPTSLRPSSPPSADASVHPTNEAFIQHSPDDSDASDASFGFKHHPAVGRITNGMYHGPEHCWARTVLHKTKVKCHPRSVSYPSRKSSATIRAPARLPTQPRLIQFWDRWSASNDLPSPSYFSSSKRKRHFSRIVTLLGLVPFEKNHGAASMIVNSG